MNATPNDMSQNTENLTRQHPERMRGTSERTFTAVVQLVCGFISLVCGLVLVLLKTPYDDDYSGHQIARFGKIAFGIWGGLVFIATAIPYFFGRDKKSIVGLYLEFCLASSVIAVVGLGLSITAINKIGCMNTESSICRHKDLEIRRDQQYRCCFENYRYYSDCRPSPHYNSDYFRYEYHRSSSNYYDYTRYDNHRNPSYYDYNQPTEYPRLRYDSPECESFRLNLRDSYDECLQEVKRSYVPHLVFYGIIIAVVSVELFASVFGACASLSALCNCCVGGKPTQYYPCSFNQLMVNDSLNNMVIPPPVTTQQPEPADTGTTQIPHMYIELNGPPQSGPQRY